MNTRKLIIALIIIAVVGGVALLAWTQLKDLVGAHFSRFLRH